MAEASELVARTGAIGDDTGRRAMLVMVIPSVVADRTMAAIGAGLCLRLPRSVGDGEQGFLNLQAAHLLHKLIGSFKNIWLTGVFFTLNPSYYPVPR